MDSVQIRSDTLFGRTLAKFPDGPRPMFVVPLAEADSIRTAHPDRSALVLFAIPIGLALAFALVMASAF